MEGLTETGLNKLPASTNWTDSNWNANVETAGNPNAGNPNAGNARKLPAS
jgi:hypothetical protein